MKWGNRVRNEWGELRRQIMDCPWLWAIVALAMGYFAVRTVWP